MIHIKLVLFSLVSAVIICTPTFLNGLPFLYYDSAYYVIVGIFSYSPDVYFWRPLTYSYFLRFCFLFYQSLVWPVFVQNVLLCLGVSYFVKSFVGRFGWREMSGLLAILLLSPFANSANFLIPDVYAGFLPLALGSIWAAKKWNWPAFLILGYVTALHYINVVIGVSGFVAIMLGRQGARKLWALAIALPLLLISTLNFVQSEKLFFSNTTEIFLFSRLAGMHLVDEYLDENCPTKKYKICQHRNPGFQIWDWSADSQIGKLGGLHQMEGEIKEINRAILFGGYFGRYLGRGFKASWTQFWSFADPMPTVLNDEGIRSHFDNISLRLVEQYKTQPIQNWNLSPVYKGLGYIQWILFFASIVFLVFYHRKFRLSSQVLAASQMLILVYVLNAFICGYMTDPLARYSDRILWALPVLAWIQFCRHRQPATSAESVG